MDAPPVAQAIAGGPRSNIVPEKDCSLPFYVRYSISFILSFFLSYLLSFFLSLFLPSLSFVF